MTSGVRAPAVAGRFYPSRAEELLRDVRKFTSADKTPTETGRVAAIGCVAPHAGYIYSGGVAGAVFFPLENPPRCGVFRPHHTGKGGPPALLSDTTRQNPLGVVTGGLGFCGPVLHRV